MHTSTGPVSGISAAVLQTGTAASTTARTGTKAVARNLANGLTVIVQENHANPTVTIGGFIQAGSTNDPQGQFGTAAMTAEMLTRGTSSLSSQQIAEQTDFVGARLGYSATRERIGLGAAMLAENFSPILTLMADTLRHPTFPTTEIEKVRGQTLTALRESADDTATVAARGLYALLYPRDMAYQHAPEGAEKDVAGITREDLIAYYQRGFRPEKITLVIVGDVTAETAFSAVEKAFGDWTGDGAGFAEAEASPQSSAVPPADPVLVPMADKSQDDIVMGEVGFSRLTPDYHAAALMNLILGGDEFVSRVGKRVRDTEGLAYYAYTAFSPGIKPGPFVFRAGANPKNVLRAVASARAEIEKMALKGVTREELAWAKDHAIGSLRLSLSTNAGIVALLENAAFYHLGLDYGQKYAGIVRAVTKEQVDAAAHKYLHADRLITVIAGPPITNTPLTGK